MIHILSHFILENKAAIINVIIATALGIATSMKKLLILYQIQITINTTITEIILEVFVFTILSFPVTKTLEWGWRRLFRKRRI